MSKFVMAEFQPIEMYAQPYQQGTLTPRRIPGSPDGKPGEVQRIPRSQLKEKWWIYVEDAPDEVPIPEPAPVEEKPRVMVKRRFISWRLGEAPYQRGVLIPIKVRGAPSSFSENQIYEVPLEDASAPYWEAVDK